MADIKVYDNNITVTVPDEGKTRLVCLIYEHEEAGMKPVESSNEQAADNDGDEKHADAAMMDDEPNKVVPDVKDGEKRVSAMIQGDEPNKTNGGSCTDDKADAAIPGQLTADPTVPQEAKKDEADKADAAKATGKVNLVKEQQQEAKSDTGVTEKEPESNDQTINSKQREMPKEQIPFPNLAGYKELRNRLSGIIEALSSAKEPGDVANGLNDADSFMNVLMDFPPLSTYVPNVRGTIRSAQMHDTTRGAVIEGLQIVWQAIDAKIAELKEQEQKAAMAKLLQNMAARIVENPELAAKIVELFGVKGIIDGVDMAVFGE